MPMEGADTDRDDLARPDSGSELMLSPRHQWIPESLPGLRTGIPLLRKPDENFTDAPHTPSATYVPVGVAAGVGAAAVARCAASSPVVMIKFDADEQ
jgi:hypothetical protein